MRRDSARLAARTFLVLCALDVGCSDTKVPPAGTDSSSAAKLAPTAAPARGLVATPRACVVTSSVAGERGTWRNDAGGIQPMKYGTTTKLGAACDTVLVVKLRAAPAPTLALTVEVTSMGALSRQWVTATPAAPTHYTAAPASVCRFDATDPPDGRGRLYGAAGGLCTVTATQGAAAAAVSAAALTVTVRPAPVVVTPPPPAPPPDTQPTLPPVVVVDTQPTPPVPPSAGDPEPPRGVPSLAVPPPLRTVRVAAGADLQAALNAQRPGDALELDAGATYTGTFTIPAVASDASAVAWRTIRSAGPLPSAGTRVTAATAAGFARLVTPTSEPALRTAPGAAYVLVQGVAVTTTAPSVYALVQLGDATGAQATLASVPHHLTLDRVRVAGTPEGDVRRCVALNSAWTAIVDSEFAECHARGVDSQAIWGSNGPGPFLILNNSLEGAGENVMFGGDDARASSLVPADLTFLRNYVGKPDAWRGGPWPVKTLFELKAMTRARIEGNVFDGNWRDAQQGTALTFKSVNQECGAPWSATTDILILRNLITRTVSGLNVAGAPEAYRCPVASPASRVRIEGNVVEAEELWLTSEATADLAAVRNTVRGDAGPLLRFNSGLHPGLRLLANDAPADSYGNAVTSADGRGTGDAAVAYHASGATILGNRVRVPASHDAGVSSVRALPSTNGAPSADAGADTARVRALADSVRRGVRVP